MAAISTGSRLARNPSNVLEETSVDSIDPVSLPLGNLTNPLDEDLEFVSQGTSDPYFVFSWRVEAEYLSCLLPGRHCSQSMVKSRNAQTLEVPVDDRIYESKTASKSIGRPRVFD